MVKPIDNLWMESKTFLFKDVGYYRVGGLTKVFKVTTKKGGIWIGDISWFRPRLRYCFFPTSAGIGLSDSELQAIAEFTKIKTEEYKDRK